MKKIANALLHLDNDYQFPVSKASKAPARKSALIIEKEGWLEKEGSMAKSWKRRYFTLQGGTIEYFEDLEKTAKKGVFHLTAESDIDIDHSRGPEALYLLIKGGVKGFDEYGSSAAQLVA